MKLYSEIGLIVFGENFVLLLNMKTSILLRSVKIVERLL